MTGVSAIPVNRFKMKLVNAIPAEAPAITVRATHTFPRPVVHVNASNAFNIIMEGKKK